MSNDDDIFDDDFSDFGDTDGDINNDGSSGSKGSLLDLWHSNPLVKIVIIATLLVVGIGSVYAFVFTGEKDVERSRLGSAVNDSEAPGQIVSENFADALDERNQQNLEAALGNRNVSAIPVPVNRGESGLQFDGSQDIQTEDPLAIWQRENREPVATAEAPQQEEQIIPEPLVLPPPPQQVAVPQEDLQGLNQAISAQIQSILANRQVKPGQYQALPTENADGSLIGRSRAGAEQAGLIEGGNNDSNRVEEILVPAGTILYGQILNEANSDTPGPILAQVLSGPVSGARFIGEFESREEKIIITFNTAVVKGVGRSMSGIAIDPATTSPGLATDIDRRYFRRIILPAAAEFIQGLGSAYADQETQVTTSGDVIITTEEKLETKQQFAKGVERGAERAANILEEDGNKLRSLIRVEAGTPIGIILTEPILKPDDDTVLAQ